MQRNRATSTVLDQSGQSALLFLRSAVESLGHAKPLLTSSCSSDVADKLSLVTMVEAQVRDIITSLDPALASSIIGNHSLTEGGSRPSENAGVDVGDSLRESHVQKVSIRHSADRNAPESLKRTTIRDHANSTADEPTSASSKGKSSVMKKLSRRKKGGNKGALASDSHAEHKTQSEADRQLKVARAQEAFVLLDSDQSGSLNVDELRVALKHIVPHSQEEQLDAIMLSIVRRVDAESTGLISLQQFTDLFTTHDPSDPTLTLLQEGFENITDDLIDEFNTRTVGMVIGNDRWLLIDPSTRFSGIWDTYVAILLIITIFTMPLSMAFVEIQQRLVWLDILADATFVLDIVKHFNTGYIDDFEFTVMSRSKVRWNYASSWFLPDLLSSIPIELLGIALGNNPNEDSDVNDLRATKALKLLRLSRIAKVFRIMKLSKVTKILSQFRDRFEDHFQVQINEAWLALSRLFLSLMILAHWIGCINFMVCREYNFPPDSWVVAADLVDASVETQYSWCFFKALMEMIGLGFESPPLVNTVCTERTDWCTIEHWITLICLYIGSIFYALLISSVSFVTANLDKGGSNLAEILWGINEYLKNKKIPIPLKDKVRSFFRLQFSEGKWYDDDDILKVLPPNLRGEIVSFNQRKIIHQVPLFSPERSPAAFVGRLAPYLSTRLMFSGEIVFEEDTTGEEIFFIKSGIVQILSKFCDPAVKAIADGCYFGDVACLLGCKRTASTRARTNCSVDVLLKEHLLKLLVDYPQVLQYMVDVAKKRKLRLDCLDSAKNVPALSDEQLVDEEDLGTRYFMKLEEKAALGTFDVGTNSQLEDLDHLAAKFRAFSEESDEEEELSGTRYAGNDDDDMEFSPLRDLDTKRSPPSPRYFVKQESGFLQAAGGDLGELKDLAAAAVGGKATSFPPNEESTSPPPSPRFYVKQSSGALKLEGGDDGEDKEVVAPKSTLKSSADDVPPKTSVAAKHSFVLDEVGDDDLEGSMHKTADLLAQESQGSSKPVRGGGRGGGERSSRRSVANHEVPPKPAKTRASPVKGSPRQSPPRKPDKGVQPRSRTVTEEYSLFRGALGDSSVALDDYASELAESTELTAVTATPSSGQYNKFKEVKNEGSTVL